MNLYLEVIGFLFSYIHSIFAQTCSGPIQIKSDHLNKRMLNNTILEKILPHHDCARLCMTYPMCKSINFNPSGNVCELNRKASSDIGSYTFQNAPRVIFTDIKDWPSAMAGVCMGNDCTDTQRCVPVGSTHQCVDIVCQTPERVRYAEVSPGEVTLGSNRTYSFKCPPGQYAPGNKTITCQFPGLWSSLQAKCITGPKTCDELRRCSSGNLGDGHYWLSPAAFGTKAVKIYCHKMNTTSPTEYITLNPVSNYGTRRGSVEVDDWSHNKIRVNPQDMTIVKGDYTFCTKVMGSLCDIYETYGYSSGYSGKYGEFRIDTTGTGVIIDQSITWNNLLSTHVYGDISDFVRLAGGSIISGKCTGPNLTWGLCHFTNSSLILQYKPDDYVLQDGVIPATCV